MHNFYKKLIIAVLPLFLATFAFADVHVVDHPLVQHKLTLMREKETSSCEFRRLLREIAMFLTYEATRDLTTKQIDIETPISQMSAPMLSGKKLCFVSILRAGNGLLEGMLELVPSARVAHIGMYRDPETLTPVEYYFKTPPEMDSRDAFVVDPMLATGNTAIASISRLKEKHPKSIRFICLVAAPEGIRNLQAAHPDVEIYVAAIDEKLNEYAYIVPGLGDAGDRMYGTVDLLNKVHPGI